MFRCEGLGSLGPRFWGSVQGSGYLTGKDTARNVTYDQDSLNLDGSDLLQRGDRRCCRSPFRSPGRSIPTRRAGYSTGTVRPRPSFRMLSEA